MFGILNDSYIPEYGLFYSLFSISKEKKRKKKTHVIVPYSKAIPKEQNLWPFQYVGWGRTTTVVATDIPIRSVFILPTRLLSIVDDSSYAWTHESDVEPFDTPPLVQQSEYGIHGLTKETDPFVTTDHHHYDTKTEIKTDTNPTSNNSTATSASTTTTNSCWSTRAPRIRSEADDNDTDSKTVSSHKRSSVLHHVVQGGHQIGDRLQNSTVNGRVLVQEAPDSQALLHESTSAALCRVLVPQKRTRSNQLLVMADIVINDAEEDDHATHEHHHSEEETDAVDASCSSTLDHSAASVASSLDTASAPTIHYPKSTLTYSRIRENQLTQTCYDGLQCARRKTGDCVRMHGEVDPEQQAYYNKHPERCAAEKWGHAVCWHYLAKRRCPVGTKCQYRHFRKMIPLSTKQAAWVDQKKFDYSSKK